MALAPDCKCRSQDTAGNLDLEIWDEHGYRGSGYARSASPHAVAGHRVSFSVLEVLATIGLQHAHMISLGTSQRLFTVGKCGKEASMEP